MAGIFPFIVLTLFFVTAILSMTMSCSYIVPGILDFSVVVIFFASIVLGFQLGKPELIIAIILSLVSVILHYTRYNTNDDTCKYRLPISVLKLIALLFLVVILVTRFKSIPLLN